MSSLGSFNKPPHTTRAPSFRTTATTDSPFTRKLEQIYGLNLATPSKNEGQCQILSYTPGNPFQLFAPFTSPEITLCRSFSQWLGHFGWIIYALMVMIVGAGSGFPDTEFGVGPACTPQQPAVNKAMCQLKDILEENMAEFRFLIAFVLAGFVARVVAVWAERRKNYAALCGATRELTILLNSFLPINIHEDENIKSVRYRLSRWVMLAYELAVLKPKGHMDDSIGREYLVRRGLVRGREWETMVPTDRHTTVYFWIQTQLVQLEKAGSLNPHYVLSLSNSIRNARSQANDLMSSLDRDLPFPYVNICFLLVAINVFIFSTFKGVLWSIWLYSNGNRLAAQPMFWIDLLSTFAWNLSYTALYQLCYVLYNPFGSKKIDIAHATIGGAIQSLSIQLAGVKGRLPKDITNPKPPPPQYYTPAAPAKNVPVRARAPPQTMGNFEQQKQQQQRPLAFKLDKKTPSGLLIITEDASLAESSIEHETRTFL